MCVVNQPVEWEKIGRGRFDLLQNNRGEYSLWLETQDGYGVRYSIDKLEEWMTLAIEQGVVNDGNIKLSRSFTFRPKVSKGDQPLSVGEASQTRRSTESNSPAHQVQRYFDNEYDDK